MGRANLADHPDGSMACRAEVSVEPGSWCPVQDRAAGQAGGKLELRNRTASRWLICGPADGDSQLYLLDLIAVRRSSSRREARVLSFAFSPDGHIIYFFAENSLGGSDLFTLNGLTLRPYPNA